MRQKQLIAALSGTAIAGLFGAAAYAANPEPVVIEVEFVAPVTITETNALQFGLLDVNMGGGETVVIAPGGGVTDAASNRLNLAQLPAALTVTATGSEPINILVDSVSGNTGYTIGTFMCEYDGGAAAACDGAGLNTTSAAGGSGALAIGATLTGTGGAVVGAANGAFNVTVAYL